MPSFISRIFGYTGQRPKPKASTPAPATRTTSRRGPPLRDYLGEYYPYSSGTQSTIDADDSSTWEFPPQSVASSNLSTVAYDPVNHRLEVTFHGSGTYVYSNVAMSVYEGLMSAGSKGHYFHEHIKQRFVFDKIR
jgi:hypothetical protein